MKPFIPPKPPFQEYKKTVFTKAAAVADFIFQIGEYEALRLPSQEASVPDIPSKEMQEKLSYLKSCLEKYRALTGIGRGITAVQVGIPERFSVVYTRDSYLFIINPVITKSSTKLLKYPEICMSANPIIAPTIRPAWIEFEYYDETGEKKEWQTKDDTTQGRMLNRVFQHEIDHMEGIINIDKVVSPRELILQSDPTYYDSATFEEIDND